MDTPSCTLYNQTASGLIRTVLSGIQWESHQAASIGKSGLTSADSTAILIPFSVDAGGKTYRLPKAFAANPDGAFTFAKGDLLVKGVIETDYAKKAEILASHDDTATITSVDTMDYGSEELWHWEIGGS